MELGKVPPHDIEAEQAVLGSMLTDKEAVFSALELLKEDSFYREDNRAIFAAIVMHKVPLSHNLLWAKPVSE